MHRSTKFTYAAILSSLTLVAALVVYTGLTFVPESRVRFNSLRLVEAARTGCTDRHSSLDYDFQFDCLFRINAPNTEIPANWDVRLTPLERLSFFFAKLSSCEKLPMGLGGGSLPIEHAESCVILVDVNRTYNVLPGSPLAVAKLMGEDGASRVVYVSAAAK